MCITRLIALCCVYCSIVLPTFAQPSVPAFYLEALDKIQSRALTIDPDITQQEMLRASLKAYLETLDRFSSYLTPDEYAAFKALQKSSYIGIGMGLEAAPDGRFVCIPHADSPAEAAGLRYGDVLRAVDGEDIAGKTMMAIATLVKGAEGTTVDLTIERGGKQHTFRVTRQMLRSETVRINREHAVPILKISSFKPSTQRELRSALAVLQDVPFLVLDLRGNPGGDLYSAIDATMFFLDTNEPIVTLKPRTGAAKAYNSSNPRFNPGMQVFIWQDERTASAAEVFIAALTQNQQAQAIGKPTYGKGVMQDVIELSDGSALLLSTAFLQTPDGTVYDAEGLAPNETLTADFPKTADYLAKMTQLTGQPRLAASPAPVSTATPTVTPPPLTPTALPTSVPTPQPAAPTPQLEVTGEHVICFDKVYHTREEARIRLAAIQKSFKQLPMPYFLQRSRPKAVEYLICFGGFTSLTEAEQEQQRISEATNFPMFLQEIPKQPPVSATPSVLTSPPVPEHSPHPPTATPGQKEADTGIIRVDAPRKQSWGMLVGSYARYATAKEVAENILSKRGKYALSAQIISSARGRVAAQYHVFIGPYNARDKDLLEALKRDRILPSDAVWQLMPF